MPAWSHRRQSAPSRRFDFSNSSSLRPDTMKLEYEISKSARSRPAFDQAALDGRQRDGINERKRAERMNDHAVGDLACHFCHVWSDGGENHLGCAVVLIFRGEGRGHQRVRVELADEFELLAVVPVCPDCAHREHEFAHLRGGRDPTAC